MSAVPPYPKDEIVPGVLPQEPPMVYDDDKGLDKEEGIAKVVSTLPGDGDAEEADQAYLNASKSTKFYRSVLLQMLLFGMYV